MVPRRVSAGLMMYRQADAGIEVLLAHPGGPFWVKKDAGVWTIPKGEVNPGEDLLAAAQREFGEETGFVARGPFFDLGSVTQGSGKVVFAWAFAGDCDVRELKSNTCEIEWPPRSGKRITIPEVDRGEWFTLERAAQAILKAQVALLERLRVLLDDSCNPDGQTTSNGQSRSPAAQVLDGISKRKQGSRA